jgi:hypothetical protein
VSARAAGLGLALLLAGGCAHQLRIEPPPTEPAGAGGLVPAPLLIEWVAVVGPWSRGRADDAFVNRVVMDLRRARAFQTVLPPAAAASAGPNVVRLRMELVEQLDEHWGPNLGKAIAIGMSLLTLSPFLPIEVGYQVEVRTQAVTCDDWMRDFRSAALGELRYRVLLSDEQKGRRQLVEQVTERALRQAIDQLAGDAVLRERVTSLVREGDCNQKVLVP